MTTKLTAVEGWAQVFKTIIDECDPQALTEADGYVWRYVANQRKEIERLRAENAELRTANAAFAEADRKQNDELGWFGRREALVEAIKAATNLHAEALATLALQEWEEINPKPGAGT